MPSPLPATSTPDRAVLIAGYSGRALAQSARRAGFTPLTADLFGDLDTQAAAEAFEIVPGSIAGGLDGPGLLAALKRLGETGGPVGLVCGAGFERDLSLLRTIETRWPLLGNPSAVVEAAKNPVALQAHCAKLGVSHPEMSLAAPAGADWLAKERGGSGGGHILAAADAPERKGRYYQKLVDGIPVSALFLGDGADSRIVGWSRQWCAPSVREPYRYGGAATPCGLSEARLAPLAEAVARLAAALSLKGLNSADFIVGQADWWLLEINPRSGASLDAFADPQGRLFTAHVEAAQGKLPKEPFAWPGARAAAIAYAQRPIAAIPAIAWPDWALDRQRPGTSVSEGAPLCTVCADAPDATAAIAQAQARIHLIRSRLEPP